MRLKLITGILMLSVAPCAMAANASQLTEIGVQKGDNATTLTIRANGAFTHTEYRPTDNLLLVDLAGVSAGTMQNRSMDLHGDPGVDSYHVVTYKGANGAEITRVELSMAADSKVGIHESKGAVVVQVNPSAATSAQAAPIAKTEMMASAAAPEEPKPAAANPAATTPAKSAIMKSADQPKPEVTGNAGRPAKVEHVSVVRGHDGLNIGIIANGAITPKAMTLTSPDRIVIDIANSVPSRKRQSIPVNTAGVKDIRIAHYSANPPSTRIVVDLAKMQGYELAQNGSHPMLMLRDAASMAKPVEAAVPAAATALVAKSQPMEAPAASAAVAKSPVLVEPTVVTRPATQEEAAALKSATTSPAQRANDAASHFESNPAQQVPVSNANASLKSEPALNLAMLQQQAQSAAAQQAATTQTASCNSGHYNGEPISVNLKEVDLRDFFRLIHEISGLNVVLDPQVRGNLTIVLDDVPWDQALSIVLKNNGLDCQLEGNVLRIANTSTLKAEADARRAQIEAEALAVDTRTITRYLSYAKASETLPTVKTFLSQRGTIIADQRTNSLIISDIPSVLPNVDNLLKELDRKTQEVEIEARVVAATRNFARDIGTQLGFGVGGSHFALGGAPQNATSNQIITGLTPSYFTTGNAIPLFSDLAAAGNSGLGFSTFTNGYRLDMILTAGESRGLLKILSRPRVVTQNNIQAVIRQGTRIPVVTPGQLGGPASVQYIDAFLRLTVTPQITAEGTIFLTVDVENTTPDRSFAVGGNPSLLTQQTTTQVLVGDGGTLVIGGVMQTQNSIAIAQTPLLGNIPILGNLFKRRTVSTTTQELIFFITPKILQT